MNVGDRVSWKSQSQGSWKEKRGEIAQVVPSGELPAKDVFPSLYTGAGPGFSRNHESYVVLVGNKPYWPRVKNLKAE